MTHDHAHQLVVTDTPNGRDYDWTYPDDCGGLAQCPFAYRLHRARPEAIAEMTDGFPAGTYLLGLWGFHGLCLVDEDGQLLDSDLAICQAILAATEAA